MGHDRHDPGHDEKNDRGQRLGRKLVGPLGIVKIAGDSARVVVFLSEYHGPDERIFSVLNLLPIPMLDGGHVVFTSIEMLRGKPLPDRLQMTVMQIGIVMLGAIMIFVTYNDLTDCCRERVYPCAHSFRTIAESCK